jgi:hypothetical protein
MLSGPIPVRVLRAAQFHELVAQLVEWGRQGEMSYVPEMRTQLLHKTGGVGLGNLSGPAVSPRFDFRTCVAMGRGPAFIRSWHRIGRPGSRA